MAEEKVKLNLGGREVQASPVEISQSMEQWNEYLMSDGTVLKMKLVLKKVFKVDGEFDAEGNPVYVMQSTNVSSLTSPKNLKRPEGG